VRSALGRAEYAEPGSRSEGKFSRRLRLTYPTEIALTERRYGARSQPDLPQWLNLVALGTVCDLVPLAGLNRVLVSHGLRVAWQAQNPGSRSLAAVCDR
jgi:single-stranded DNA-specific DHH superfamily exonuclease